MNIVVTGGFGSGKSTVSKLLAVALSAELIDTDGLCRQQLIPGSKGYSRFVGEFGSKYLRKDGIIDRGALKKTFFSDADVKKKVEDILHPIVCGEVVGQCDRFSEEGKNLVVEVPLLFEVGWENYFHHIVLAYTSEEICMERVAQRDTLAPVIIHKVLAAQMPIDQKRLHSDFVVDTSSTFVSTVQQVAWLVKILQNGV